MGRRSDVRWSSGMGRLFSIASLLILAFASPVQSALYTCTEPSGVSVITDSPAQLRDCTLLSSTRSSTPAQPDPDPDPDPDPALEPQPPRVHEPAANHASQPATLSSLSIPLERVGSLYVVTVQVNGTRPAKMILDTGASHTIVSFAVARDLSLWALQRATPMTMHTAGGTVQADVLPITSIQIGEAEVRDIEAVIHDLPDAPPGIEGLLGLNVLRRFTVTLDTVHHRLVLGGQP